MNTLLLYIRSTFYWFGLLITTLLYGLVSPLLILLSPQQAYHVVMPWAHFNLWWLKITCGVDSNIIGRENFDLNNRGIVLSNHQSTWETMMIPTFLPAASFVIKKELLKIPFFGWALSSVKPIAIDRNAGSSAVDQVKSIGKERLDAGNWVCIFPEGTRVEPGQRKDYRMGGALLVEYSGYPVYPIAHNAGECWPRHSYLKYPGTITMVIGKPFSAKGLTPEEINDKVRNWIEAEIEKMPPAVKNKI